MLSNSKLFFFFFLLLVFILGGSLLVQADETKKVENLLPGTKSIVGWKMFGCQFALEVAKSGREDKSALIINNPTDSFKSFKVLPTSRLSVQSNKIYKVSIGYRTDKLKIDGSGDIRLRIEFYNSDSSQIEHLDDGNIVTAKKGISKTQTKFKNQKALMIHFMKNTENWEDVKFNIYPPENTTKIKMMIDFYNGIKGKMMFDKFKMVKE